MVNQFPFCFWLPLSIITRAVFTNRLPFPKLTSLRPFTVQIAKCLVTFTLCLLSLPSLFPFVFFSFRWSDENFLDAFFTGNFVS